MDLKDLEKRVWRKVNTLIEPETSLTFKEMRLIKNVEEVEPRVIQVRFKPSSPLCPIAFKLAQDIRNAVLEVEGVSRVYVYCHGHRWDERINETINAGNG